MFTKPKKLTDKDCFYSTNPRSHRVRDTLGVLILVAVFAVAATTRAHAQQGPNPMDGVAETLNLEPAQLRGCMGEPPEPGSQPSERERDALIECLIGQNPALSADQINEAMGAMRNGAPPPPSN